VSEVSKLADRPSRTLEEFKQVACIGTVESEAPVCMPSRASDRNVISNQTPRSSLGITASIGEHVFVRCRWRRSRMVLRNGL
jgi:hypothetical protein